MRGTKRRFFPPPNSNHNSDTQPPKKLSIVSSEYETNESEATQLGMKQVRLYPLCVSRRHEFFQNVYSVTYFAIIASFVGKENNENGKVFWSREFEWARKHTHTHRE